MPGRCGQSDEFQLPSEAEIGQLLLDDHSMKQPFKRSQHSATCRRAESHYSAEAANSLGDACVGSLGPSSLLPSA